MAISGTILGSYSGGSSYKPYLKWSVTQNTSSNTSTMKVEFGMYKASSNNTSYNSDNKTITIKVNGTTYSRSAGFDFRSASVGSYNAMITITGISIAHNSDGSKSVSISASHPTGIGLNTGTVSGTAALTKIARASTISSASNVTLGNNCSIKWTPASNSFRYKLKFSLGSWSHTTGVITPGTTNSYTYSGYSIPISIAQQILKSTTGTMTVYLYTYSNSSATTQVGSSSSKTFIVTVPATVIPTISTVSAIIDNSANSVIENWGIAVAGYTKVKITASAIGAQGSTISSFTISGGYSATKSGSSLNYNGAIISSSGSKTFTTVAKDSRGRTSSPKSSNAIMFYAYSNPNVSSFTVKRANDDVSKIIVKADWNFASVNGKNSATATLQYKKSTATSWTTYGTIEKNTNTTLTTIFEDAASYNFKITVKDALGKSASKEAFVSTVAVLMDFKAGGKGLGIGKVAESDALEIGLKTIFIGNIYIRDGNTDIPLSTYIKNIINDK